ncbi:MAG: NUDIX domain-containing protein [Anaerolineae bacterium]|jgi:ADP-ribose pyrophosphatase YjhB (NUDIX family)
MVTIVRESRVCERGRLAMGCSAAVLDPTGTRILLVRRADSGRWAVPGGYMEPGETFLEACSREVLEETGLCVCPGRLIAVYTSPHVLLEYADGNCLQLVVLHFAASPIGGELSTSPETSEVRYVPREEIERLDMSGFNRQRVDDAFADWPMTFIREDFDLS